MRPSPLQKIHSLFYITTGIWPLLNRRSFEAVTGPKTDWWLVNTVGVLVTAIGVTLWKAESESDAKRLAVLSALGLAAIDISYTQKRVISPVYLLDAAAELSLVAAWQLSKAKPSLLSRANA